MATSRVCSIDGCGKAMNCRGYCQMHYTRWKRHGDPLTALKGGKPPRGLCSIDGCGKPHSARGFCDTHYARWLKRGTPEASWTLYGEPSAWLQAHVAHEGAACLIWPFARYPDGRCAIRVKGRTVHATPIMCEAAHGPRPTPEHEAAHGCGKGHEGCINPQHLRWATRSENMADTLIHDTHIRGERHPMVKLTEADIRQIRSLASTMTHREIALMFDISRPHVGEIVRRKAWSWLN